MNSFYFFLKLTFSVIFLRRDASPGKQRKLSKQNLKLGVYDQEGKLLDKYETYFEGPFKLQF